jgi:hypothetical protein
MKPRLFIALLLIINCLPKLPYFPQIEDNKLRVLAVVFLPRPDISPGDTITARAWFAGKPVVRTDNFRISFNKINDDSFIEQTDVGIVHEKMWLPDSMEVSFVIPDSLLFENSNYSGIMPIIIDNIRNMAKDTTGCAVLKNGDSSAIMNALYKLYRESCLLFDLYSDDGTILKIQSRFMVRYNSHFHDCMEVNNNPNISTVKLFTVDGDNIKSFDPTKPEFQGRFSSQLLYSASSPSSVAETVWVSSGKSYFLVSDSASTDFYTNNLGIRESEIMKYTYFYEIDTAITSVPDSVLIQLNPTSPIAKLQMPVINGSCSIKIWLVLHDDSNDAIRPKGFAVKIMNLVLKRQ